MKTLFINIKGDIIPSDDNLIVVGRPEDAIVNKFFFELGKEILKGVVVPGVTSIKKKDIVTAFRDHDDESFYSILKQWDNLKQELLGENPSVSRTVKLPDEYISWLQNSSQPVYAEIAKSLYKRGSCVEVSLDKIYKNAVGIIVNNIDPEECKNCGQFVVNDDAVTDDSAISVSIQEIFPQIAFMPFEDFGKCPKCGKKPCECEPESPVCPKCGKNPCECINNKPLFAVATYDINYREVKENFRFQICDIHGRLVDNRHFLRIFHDDVFGKERSAHYYYERFLPDAYGFEEQSLIRPLLGFCIEDGHLYYISKNGFVDICDYTHGRCDGEGSLYYYHDENVCDKYVSIKDNYVFVYDKKKGKRIWTTIFEINGDQAQIRLKAQSKIEDSQLWILRQNKYNYIQEDDCIYPVRIGTEDCVKFADYKVAYYLGTNANGNDLFIAETTNNRSSKEWSVITESGVFICKLPFDEIVDITKDRRHIIMREFDYEWRIQYGITSIEGKMVVGKQYYSIKEIQQGLFEMETYESETEYFSLKENDFYQGLFKGYIWKNNKLFNTENDVIFDNCINCCYLIKDLFHCCNSKNEWWIVNHSGKLYQTNWRINCDYYKDNSLNKPQFRQNSDKLIAVIDDKPSIVSTDGSLKYIKYNPTTPFVYGIALFVSDNNSILYYDEEGNLNVVPWSCRKKIIDVRMFSRNLILVTLTNKNNSAKYEILLTLDGRELLEQNHHGTYTNIVKLSEEYFSVYNNGCCVMDMEGNVIIKPRYSKIALIN